MTIRTVVLPKLLVHQKDIALDDHRFKIVDAGRRFGKTLWGLVACLDGHGPLVNGVPKYRGALHGAVVWWVAPTYPIAAKIWRDLKAALIRWGGELQKSETERRIEFPGGGSITVKSAHDPSVLVGDGIDGLVIDEAAKCSEDTWSLYLRPTLADREGWCVMISTPEGMNWFYTEWLLGAEKQDPDYASWKRPTSDNPTISADEIDRMRRRMGLYRFQRECLAEFVVAEGGLFKREWFKFFREENGSLIPEKGKPVKADELFVFLTADFAGTVKTYSDFTVVGTWGRSPDGRLWLLDLWRGRLEAPAITPLLARIVRNVGAANTPIWVEASGPLVRVNNEAREYGLNVVEIPIHKENKDKVARNEPAAAAVEQGRVLIREGAQWVSEFLAECCAFPDPAVHDDQVDVLGHAVFASPPPPPQGKPTPIDQPKPWDGPEWDYGTGGNWDTFAGGGSWS